MFSGGTFSIHGQASPEQSLSGIDIHSLKRSQATGSPLPRKRKNSVSESRSQRGGGRGEGDGSRGVGDAETDMEGVTLIEGVFDGVGSGVALINSSIKGKAEGCRRFAPNAGASASDLNGPAYTSQQMGNPTLELVKPSTGIE